MKFIFRGITIFEYQPNAEEKIVENKIHGTIPAFNFCRFIKSDYKLLSLFFETAHDHMNGKKVDLEDIIVN